MHPVTQNANLYNRTEIFLLTQNQEPTKYVFVAEHRQAGGEGMASKQQIGQYTLYET